MNFTEKERCMLCDRGGKLLICSDNGCPISVHKDCMGCNPRFTETGNFYCPYCVYRQLTTETSRLRDKAMLAKKALSSFLGENFRHENHPKSQVFQNRSKSSSVSESKDESSVSEQSDRIPDRHGEVSRVCDGDNTCRIMVVYGGDEFKNGDEVESNECKGIGVEVEDQEESSMKQSRWNVNPPLKGKRKKWSEEEEDMLKEGVHKFSSTANKKLPWIKILEFGRHVFEASRTPSDLKDKWRNMTK